MKDNSYSCDLRNQLMEYLKAHDENINSFAERAGMIRQSVYKFLTSPEAAISYDGAMKIIYAMQCNEKSKNTTCDAAEINFMMHHVKNDIAMLNQHINAVTAYLNAVENNAAEIQQ